MGKGTKGSILWLLCPRAFQINFIYKKKSRFTAGALHLLEDAERVFVVFFFFFVNPRTRRRRGRSDKK